MTFEKEIIDNAVSKLIKGDDYRDEVVNAINVSFLDFAVDFFKKIITAKIKENNVDLAWYKKHFIAADNISSDDKAIFSGINKKTITNIHGSATKKIVLDIASANFEYLSELISSLEKDSESGIVLNIKISYKEVSVELSLIESLLVINALATKKIAIRGGAWSSIGKKIEKPLLLKLCKLCKVPKEYINSSVFKKNEALNFDREVDFKLYDSIKEKEYRVEVKLMGRGNPESADVIYARGTDIFIADTLSEQNRNQLKFENIEYIEMKGNLHCVADFKILLEKLDIPCK
ncbi:restriction endonuclease [Candidatus Endomicrobiellum trichonymphae]|uniref:Restriction endonuclease n=1 Tax=Endomicrobium trichonymphae TaxID=1408204 RepID=A0A1E5IID0_ENDTX|nr:restriction endonuclease [Candidatus Endomicrobium trichonymphae]